MIVVVEHEAAARRFSTVVDGERAVLHYGLADGVMTITHTGVPKPIEGRGIAGRLMREALNVARVNDWRVVAACSYAAAYMEKQAVQAPETRTRRQHESDLLDEALAEGFPASDTPSVGRAD